MPNTTHKFTNMRKLILALLLGAYLSAGAAVGDTTPLNADHILEVKQETVKNSKGVEHTEIVVIYKDSEGKRRIAYMTKADYKKLEQSKKYNTFVEYVLVEGKTRMKIQVK